MQKLLEELNSQMCRLHTAYEEDFWTSYMGDPSVNERKDAAQAALDSFRADKELSNRVDEALETAEGSTREKLLQWQQFFACYQAPSELLSLRAKISKKETEVEEIRAKRKEGYINPATNEFVKTSIGKMRMMMMVHDDEKVRKACFEAIEKISILHVRELIELVNLRNEYAQSLGHEDFYAYKLNLEGMTKEMLFTLCDDVYERTKYGFTTLREMEKTRPGLRLPWNKAYMLAGDVTKKKDPYLQFSDVLPRWGRTFAALGITFKGATLQLDLLDREGKYNNGFCHWPELVHFKDGVRIPGKCNFTSNAVPKQVGAGDNGLRTVSHEGGHAAHLTNVETTEVCMNHEYPPATAAWAETQSMFLDSMMPGSIEWLTRYAKDASGQPFPFEIFEEAVQKLQSIRPLEFMGVLMVVAFERELYSTPNLTEEKVREMAHRVNKKYADNEVDSSFTLMIAHVYSWESACNYHGYFLAKLAVNQWRDYFYNKYGYIVDNPNVGAEMRKVWELGASKTFPEFVAIATGKELSVEATVSELTKNVDDILATARKRIATLATVPEHTGPVELDASIRMMDGKQCIADNSQSFEHMAETYRQWVLSKE